MGKLKIAAVGYHIARHCASNFSYADDVARLSSSISGMRILMSICDRYAASHGLHYNVKKTKLNVFHYEKVPDVAKSHVIWVEVKRIFYIEATFNYL